MAKTRANNYDGEVLNDLCIFENYDIENYDNIITNTPMLVG